MTHVIIGSSGQIGSCVTEFLRSTGETDLILVDVNIEYEVKDVDLMHVCIPYNDKFDFVQTIKMYKGQFNAKNVIVYSTVLPGTCEKIGLSTVHSPVEGRHPHLIDGFRTFRRFVAGRDARLIGDFFSSKGLKVQTFDNPKITELGKLFNTTRYGVNIAFAAAEEELCKQYGLDFRDVVLEYQTMYNRGYAQLGQLHFLQSMLTPPEDKIGGHCVVPNAKLLTALSSNPLIRAVADFND